MALPEKLESGDLPPGIHIAPLNEVLSRFGSGRPERVATGTRLRKVYEVAKGTKKLRRFVVFGSFVSGKPAPNDVDVFMIMEDTFDVSVLKGESSVLFDHLAAQSYFGASVFWVRKLAALGGERAALEHWQVKRDGTFRGIVEVVQ